MTEPFLKWAGGKRWLVQNYSHLFPENWTRYIEPFLGGGAIFFWLRPKLAILSDKNTELINAYRSIKNHPEVIDAELQRLHRTHSAEQYYRIRDKQEGTTLERAVRFIYLNRTCFNGLYRENHNGLFNVPIGVKTLVAFPKEYLIGVAALLKNAALATTDFETTINRAGKGDFVFVDPPYTVMHNSNNFIKYNAALFSWQDQIRLATTVRRAISRGASIMVTNADHSCIRELYSDVGHMYSVDRTSVLAGRAIHRRRTTELVVTSY